MRKPDTRHASRREIADLADGVLAGARLARVEAHVATGCAQCSAALQRTRCVIAAVAEGPLPAPPPSVRRRAAGLYGVAWRRAVAERVHEVLASLVVDQRLAPAAALRGATGTGRRLLWLFDGAELVVSVSEHGGRSDLLGQVLPDHDGDDTADGRIEVLRDGRVVGTERLDDDGCFAARGLLGGTYVLRGSVDGTAFRTPPFVVG